MRQAVLQMGGSLEGFAAGPHGEGHGGLPPEHEDVTAWKVSSLRQAGAHIMGRLCTSRWQRTGRRRQTCTPRP